MFLFVHGVCMCRIIVINKLVRLFGEIRSFFGKLCLKLVKILKILKCEGSLCFKIVQVWKVVQIEKLFRFFFKGCKMVKFEMHLNT